MSDQKHPAWQHPIYNVTPDDLKPSVSFKIVEHPDGRVEAIPQDRTNIRFEIWWNGQKANRLADWGEFQEFLELYSIDPDGVDAAAIETGVPYELSDCVVRWIRVSP